MGENDSNDREHDLRRLAEHLDGGPERLTAEQARRARQIADDQRWLGAMLDVSVPPAVLERAFRRLDAAMADRRRPGRLRLWGPLIGAAAAAAVVVLVALLGMPDRPTATPGPTVEVDPAEAVAQFLAEEPMVIDPALTAVDEELTVAWTDLILEDEFGGMASTEAVERLFGEFWLADPLDVYVGTDGLPL